MGCGQSAQKKQAVEGENNPRILAGGPKDDTQPKMGEAQTEAPPVTQENKPDVTEASKEGEEPKTETLPTTAETRPVTETEIEVQPKADELQPEKPPTVEEAKADATPVDGGEPAGDTTNCDASPEEANIESKAADNADAGAVKANIELDEANATAQPVDGAEPESEAKDPTTGGDAVSVGPEGANDKAKVAGGVSDEKEQDAPAEDVDAEKNTGCSLFGFSCYSA